MASRLEGGPRRTGRDGSEERRTVRWVEEDETPGSMLRTNTVASNVHDNKEDLRNLRDGLEVGMFWGP